jgi:hypothetical protein
LSRNKDRLGMGETRPSVSDTPPTILQNETPGFAFVVPTEFVALPSGGRFYPESHPLHNQESIEIKQMTAKEEDMLTSRTLLKKGVALERVVQSLLVDKNINSDDLLIGDRNAIIIAMRVSGYGRAYDVQLTCPQCGNVQSENYDLNDASVYTGDEIEDHNVVRNEDGTFNTVLPRTKATVTFRALTGHDEKRLAANAMPKKNNRTNSNYEQGVTAQIAQMVTAVNGDSSVEARRYLVENIPSIDSRHLRRAYRAATPNIELIYDFECEECQHEQPMEVPLSANFFWPDR